MAEYIEREAAIDALKDAYGDSYRAEDYIRAIPAADVKPVVRSRWEKVEVTYTEDCEEAMPVAVASMYCLACNRYHNEVYFYGDPIENIRFCPNCGADMREETDAE